MPTPAIKQKAIILEKAKKLEYQKLFEQEVENYDVYQNLTEIEKSSLISKIGYVALNMVNCSESLVNRCRSILEGFNILQQIYNGKIDNQSYGALVQQGIIKVSYEVTDSFLLNICGNDEKSFNNALKFPLRAFPDNLDAQTYKERYLGYCHKVVDEIKTCMTEKYQQELTQENAATATTTEPDEVTIKPKKRVNFFDCSSTKDVDDAANSSPSMDQQEATRRPVRRERENQTNTAP